MYIDSNDRDIVNQTVSDFSITENQSETWSLQPKIVNIVPPSLNEQLLDFKSSLKVVLFSLTLRYPDTLDETLVDIPNIILLKITSNFTERAINSSLDKLELFNFVLNMDKIQHIYVNAGEKFTSVKYTTDMNQLLRFTRNGKFTISIKDKNMNDILYLDRVIFTISITPFLLDGNYYNHNIQHRV